MYMCIRQIFHRQLHNQYYTSDSHTLPFQRISLKRMLCYIWRMKHYTKPSVLNEIHIKSDNSLYVPFPLNMNFTINTKH